jgi:deazaflavin-dependent oxidoreductase (nitroreductase family)
MLTWILGAIAVATTAVLALLALLVVALRTGRPSLVRVVRLAGRQVFNPRVLRTAGRPGASASVVHHVGRRSGRAYRTPVAVVPVPEGFVVVLPYGTSPDWLRNVLAAGTATIETEGERHLVARPRVVPTDEVREHLSASDRRAARLFGIDSCLVLPHAPARLGTSS